MFYGLHFTSDTGQICQVAVNTANCHIFLRALVNGSWTGWRRVDVERNADGTLNERVAEATRAQRADTAMRFVFPVRIILAGEAAGSVLTDFSGDTTISLTIPELAKIHKRLDALSSSIDRLWEYHAQ